MSEFDITKYKWSDCCTSAEIEGEKIILSGGLNYGEQDNYLNKDDAIAIAKHFGIIQEVDGQRITIHKETFNMDPKKCVAHVIGMGLCSFGGISKGEKLQGVNHSDVEFNSCTFDELSDKSKKKVLEYLPHETPLSEKSFVNELKRIKSKPLNIYSPRVTIHRAYTLLSEGDESEEHF